MSNIKTPPPEISIEAEETTQRFPVSGWLSGGIEDLADFIELSIVSEHKLAAAVDSFTAHIDATSDYLVKQLEAGTIDLSGVAEALHQASGIQTWKMACAIVGNALLFQTVIASNHPEISDPRKLLRNAKNLWKETLDEWDKILEINYWPIFSTGKEIVNCINPEHASAVLERLLALCDDLSGLDATTTGDMVGQMFGRLIADRKYLATFYTLPSSAHLLAELAVERIKSNYSSEDELTKLRIADFACGTGTLLTAVYHRIATRARHSGHNTVELHSKMLEQVIIGCDIMPAAVHLTATMLSSLQPQKEFSDTRIHLLPFGKNDKTPSGISIGSLELMDLESTPEPLWDIGKSVTSGKGDTNRIHIPGDNGCDLVIMNPPFTSHTSSDQIDPAKGVFNPAYAAFRASKTEQSQMAEREKYLAKKRKGSVGNGNAGLSSYFIDIANIKVKQGGIIAFIVPFTILSGSSYKKCRELLTNHYSDICILSMTGTTSEDRAFSADTGMAEIMFVATKRKMNDKIHPEVFYITLRKRPQSLLEAVELAKKCNEIRNKSSRNSTSGILFLGEEEFGVWIRSNRLEDGFAGVLDTDLIQSAENLCNGTFTLPRIGKMKQIPMCKLGDLGDRGPLHRDIGNRDIEGKRGPFTIFQTSNPKAAKYPILWAHNHKHETKLIVKPDMDAAPRATNDRIASQKISTNVAKIWETRSRFHSNYAFQLNSQPLSACLTETPTIGGAAWPAFKFLSENWDYAAVLWSNTIIGLISFWWTGTKTQLGRTIITITRLPELVTLDHSKLSNAQHKTAKDIFYIFSDREFLPAYKAYEDKVRQDLDRAVLSELLGLDWNEIEEPLTTLRNKWCSEPSVFGSENKKPPWLKSNQP